MAQFASQAFVILIFLTLHILVKPQEVFVGNLDDLGWRISKQVQRNLAHLNHDINAAVQPLQNLGQQITSQVNAQLAPLNNLGAQIQNSVHNSLEPVRAMEIMFKMQDGVGGTTVITHKPNGKTLVVRNRKIYECQDGEVAPNGQCTGELAPFIVKEKTDHCYNHRQVSIVNDKICVGASSVSIINNNIICQSATDQPILLMDKKEYDEMCKDLTGSVEFKYIADVEDPNHILIPNPNRFVKCKNNEQNICIFDGGHGITSSIVQISSK